MSSSEVSDAAFIRQFLIILALLVFWIVASAFLGRGLATKALADQRLRQEAVNARIEPIGKVNTVAVGESISTSQPTSLPKPVNSSSTHAEKSVQVATANVPSGQTIYQSACFACHGTGLPNIPQIGDTTAWEPRAAKGIAVLLESAINGLGAMPPRAANPQLTDAELEAAIRYILQESGLPAN